MSQSNANRVGELTGLLLRHCQLKGTKRGELIYSQPFLHLPRPAFTARLPAPPAPPLRPPPGASGYDNGNDHDYGSGHIKGGSGYHNADRNSNGNGHVYANTGRY
ncbi:uncharacterized protein [Penaeus vannamei]|uniref:uncharacterized protein isoform X1 n=1 Tax=Penaeus vannamei TaxID=6689 RepID=UPI00387FAA8D